MLWALVPDTHRLNDIVQETFLTVTRKATDFQPGTNFRAWLFAIARFKVLHSLRERRLENVLHPDGVELLCEEAPLELDREAWLMHLSSCVEELTPASRQMILLRYEKDSSIADVANALGRQVNSVKVMLSRVRAYLRECVTKRLAEQSEVSL